MVAHAEVLQARVLALDAAALAAEGRPGSGLGPAPNNLLRKNGNAAGTLLRLSRLRPGRAGGHRRGLAGVRQRGVIAYLPLVFQPRRPPEAR